MEILIFPPIIAIALLASGIQAMADGSFVLGAGLIGAGMLFAWLSVALFKGLSSKKKYRYTMSNCPNRGQKPEQGFWAQGFTLRHSSSGDDLETIVFCTDCGYFSNHFVVNPLTQLHSDFVGGVKPQTDLLPTHP